MSFYEGGLFALLLIISGAILSARLGKLSPAGAVSGTLVASVVYVSVGIPGIIMLGVFFVSAVAATSWKKSRKQKLSGSSKHQGRRSAPQVFANSAVPAIAALLILIIPDYRTALLLVVAGSLASATADTLSSELGVIYGRRFYNILSFKKEAVGADGAISVEGTLAGMAGAALIACCYSLAYNHYAGFPLIVFAGVAGNAVDSVLGSALERRGVLGNNWVNFLSTLCAAVFTIFFYFIFY